MLDIEIPFPQEIWARRKELRIWEEEKRKAEKDVG